MHLERTGDPIDTYAEVQQAYADARAATNDADYAEKMKVYACKLSEDAALF